MKNFESKYFGHGDIFTIAHYAKVEFHSYRTANPKLILMSIKRSSEAGEELEEMLYDRAREFADDPWSIQKDNHVCFSFTSVFNREEQPDDTKLVVKISDREISIGVGLDRRRW